MSSDNTFNDSKKLMSDFNEANFQILRLHNLWDECNRLSIDGQYSKWSFKLDRIWIELYADADKSNASKYLKLLKLCNERIRLSSVDKDKLYYALMLKEEFLKKLQDDVGKGSRRSSQYSDDMML